MSERTKSMVMVAGLTALGTSLAACGSMAHRESGGAEVAAAPRAYVTQQTADEAAGGVWRGRAIEGAALPPPSPLPADTEEYQDYGVRPQVPTALDMLSTFSVDVDTGSYTIARRKLREGVLPPPAAVRPEEFVNYLRQGYPDPREGAFAVVSEAAASPFRPGKTILRVGLQGRRLSEEARKRANLVFLVDTSGSMRSPDKLGLVKRSLSLLVERLRPDDVVSICTYAGSVGVALEPTPVRHRDRIQQALARLSAGGSTAMGSGIDLAYRLAADQAGPGVNTRVFVCSDGDANVGPARHPEILALIERHRERGISLGTLGFGMGNYKDTMMEQLADRGEGSYAYVDTIEEARRLFGEELVSNLEVLARDVKVQVAFYPRRVARYRLVGYENRAIRDDQFRDDRVDAGEVGAGHSVTAVYELELVPGSEGPLGEVALRYKRGERPQRGPDAAREEVHSLTGAVASAFEGASGRFRVTACAAELAEVLRKSPHVQTRLDSLERLLEGSLDPRFDDREHDLLDMVRRAAVIERRYGT